jgi:hypothetical protein
MPLLGQASGGFTESSSALRLLHVGIRNTVGVLTDDSFRQTNPPIASVAGTISTSPGLLSEVHGILSGSIAFTRPDAGSNFIGGPVTVAVSGVTVMQARNTRPLGQFINNAAGNAYENLPAVASNKGPYVAAMGTYGNRLYETQFLVAVAPFAQGASLTYLPGVDLIASVNGFLMPREVDNAGAALSLDIATFSLEVTNGRAASQTLGILKMVPDSAMTELVLDQRI